MKRVYLMRGLPGHGKSSVAEVLKAGHPEHRAGNVWTCSADDFFVQPDGRYAWDPAKLKDAHEACQSKFRAALESNVPVVIVDNTNVRRKDFAYYKTLAVEFGYQFFEVAVGNHDVDESVRRNKHAVPRATLEKMAEAWEK